VRLAESHHRLGLALRERGQIIDAQVQLEKALEIRPNVPEVINNLGSVLAQQKKMVLAIQLFEQAIVLRPNYARARFNLAESLEKVNVRRSIEEYETYLALVEGIPEEERRLLLVEERLKRLKRGN
jgi:Flp pilus assembly protein TadD